MAQGRTCRYIVMSLVVLAMAVVAGCGGGGDEEGTGIASMTQGRWGHTATLLGDGRVLVAGGQASSTTALATAEVYNSSTGEWSSVGAMKENHGEGHTATVLQDGKVLVVGGGSKISIFDPASDTWSSGSRMSGDRAWHTATLLNDGRVLVAGGNAGRVTLDTAEIYDPANDEWSSAGTMSDKFTYHSAALLPDGKVLLVGKLAVNIYDPSAGTWSIAEKAATRERWKGFSALVLRDGKIIVPGGGWNRGNSGATWVKMPEVDIYNPATGTWSAAAPLNEGRNAYAATLLKDGKVMVIGERSAEVYDPGADTWTAVGEMKISRIEGHTATLLNDGTVLIVGGKKGATRNNEAIWVGGEGRAEVGIYDPAVGW